MSGKSPEIVFPCPLSKGYGLAIHQAWQLLKVFLVYRLILSGLFIALLYNPLHDNLDSQFDSLLFVYSTRCYLLLTALSALCIWRKWLSYTSQSQLLIFSDIILITVLMHACGGVKSGIGILLAVSIGSGGLLIGGICALLFAALASLAVLTEQFYSDAILNLSNTSYSYAGMLGVAFFTIALLSYVLAKRSEENFLLASEQKQTIIKLEELNQYIIQHLQSGILITDRNEKVQMVNEAALRLTDQKKMPANLNAISKHLSLAFQDWQADSAQDFVILSFQNQPEIYSRFTRLATGLESLYMVIFEDSTLYNQRLQQSKLASLGQLTASIAHEIRNPLAAISHASQLLLENPDMSLQDKRMAEIIQNHCLRVNHIIEDVLQLSRRSDSRREKIYLQQWLENYLLNLELEAYEHVGTFKIENQQSEPVSIYFDPSHLKQILDNLCQNALRYGKPELGQIILHIGRTSHAPYIEVIDNGTGISHEHLKHLFSPFFTTSQNGTGLGLYISKELAELNQGKLSYHLSDKQRSCFRLTLLDAEKNLIEI
ncbi:two-component system sensor histidine kinase PilS [Methylosoma difficile]